MTMPTPKKAALRSAYTKRKFSDDARLDRWASLDLARHPGAPRTG